MKARKENWESRRGTKGDSVIGSKATSNKRSGLLRQHAQSCHPVSREKKAGEKRKNFVTLLRAEARRKRGDECPAS